MKVIRIHREQIDSTNARLKSLREGGEKADMYVFRADYQHEGRGQGTHGWHSLASENLLISFMFEPAFLSASRQFLLSIVAALSLTDLLESLGLHPSIKWPNDILLGSQKVAGILIEQGIRGRQVEYCIMGMGLNVLQKEFPVFPREAISLARVLDKDAPEPAILAGRLEACVLERYSQLRGGRTEKLEQDYLQHLYGRGRLMKYKWEGQERNATLVGVNEFGQLILDFGEGNKVFNMQEIAFLE